MKKLVVLALAQLILTAFPAVPAVAAQRVSQGWSICHSADKMVQHAMSKKDLLAAQELLERALKIFEAEKSPEGSARVLYLMGCIDYQLGRHEKALESLERSLEFTDLTGDINQEALSLNRIGEIYIQWGDYHKAMYYLEEALNNSRKMRSESVKAAALNNKGRVYLSWGDYERAMKYCREALWIAKRIGERREEASALNSLGDANLSLGMHGRALEYFEKSVDRSRQGKSLSSESASLVGMSSVFAAWGRYQEALEHLDSAREISGAIGDARQERLALEQSGRVFMSTGQYVTAREFFQKALDITKQLGDVKNESANLCNLGETLVALGRPEEALQHFKKALSIAELLDVTIESPLNLIGNLLTDMQRFDEAEDYLVRAGNDASLGRLYLLQSNCPESRRYYERLLAAVGGTADIENLYAAHTGLGRLCEIQGDLRGAEEHFERGVDISEQIRERLLPAQRQSFLSAKVHGFLRSEAAKGLTRVRMKLNKWEGAFQAGELTKARAFADKLVVKDIGALGQSSDNLVRREYQLTARIATLKKNHDRNVKAGNLEAQNFLANEIRLAESELRGVMEELRIARPRYVSSRYPRPVTPSEAALSTGEFAVVFDCSEDGVAVWFLEGRHVRKAHFIEWRHDELERTVRAFRESFEQGDLLFFDIDAARALFEKLLAPVIGDLAPGDHIIIVPDGVLALVPFEALVVGGKANWKLGRAGEYYPDGLIYLADRHPLSYYQSVTALSLVRNEYSTRAPGRGLLVMADPVFDDRDDRAHGVAGKISSGSTQEQAKKRMSEIHEGVDSVRFDRLVETGELAARLKEIYGSDCDGPYTGFSAHKGYLLNTIAPGMERYGQIVFATHGLLDTSMSGFAEPFLALTLFPPGTDGLVGMTDVMSLKLNADLVALTACQTGLGRMLSGEGTMSMGRAFQYAGARSVLMSLWKVDADSSVKLVEKFFRYRKDKGKTKMEALRLAREDIRNEGFGHPFFWASFILLGEVD